jgi:hypothetical protein
MSSVVEDKEATLEKMRTEYLKIAKDLKEAKVRETAVFLTRVLFLLNFVMFS